MALVRKEPTPRFGAAASTAAPHLGQVALIGCGPGDPELLTLKAVQRIAAADVLVIDRLVDSRVLDHARRDARRVLVGKTPGGPTASQDDINAILVREATAGHRVARLKGGDPLVFGRAVEEMAALEAAGISYEIVPGITAAQACAARVHLPVTARGRHRQFTLLTGATADGRLDHDWAALARPGAAFAVYMGVRSAPRIRAHLLDAGMSPATPVVIVENATLPAERVIATTLRDLVLCLHGHAIDGPAILFFGIDWAELGLHEPARLIRFARRNVVPFDPPSTPGRTARRARKAAG